MEFQRWWVLKSKIFGQKSTYSKEKKLKNSAEERQFDCEIYLMVGPKKQDFWPKINIGTQSKSL